MAVSVLVCNRTTLYAEGLRLILEADTDLLASLYVPHEPGPDAGRKINFDIVVTDLSSFPQFSGKSGKILLIWDENHPLPHLDELKRMVELGLVGILDNNADPLLLRKAVHKVNNGEMWLDRKLIQKSLCEVYSHLRPSLSHREEEILELIRCGCSNKTIADRLCISEQTVKTHCYHLYRKFGVANRLQLALRVSPTP